MTNDEPTLYERIGGEETFKQLVQIFYAKIEADERLRVIFPEDLEPGKRWQQLFLMQLFGGPTTYSQLRGHPRLRMRHAPYIIDTHSRDLWLKYMLEALDEAGIKEPALTAMQLYFERAAAHMINTYPSYPEHDHE